MDPVKHEGERVGFLLERLRVLHFAHDFAHQHVDLARARRRRRFVHGVHQLTRQSAPSPFQVLTQKRHLRLLDLELGRRPASRLRDAGGVEEARHAHTLVRDEKHVARESPRDRPPEVGVRGGREAQALGDERHAAPEPVEELLDALVEHQAAHGARAELPGAQNQRSVGRRRLRLAARAFVVFVVVSGRVWLVGARRLHRLDRAQHLAFQRLAARGRGGSLEAVVRVRSGPFVLVHRRVELAVVHRDHLLLPGDLIALHPERAHRLLRSPRRAPQPKLEVQVHQNDGDVFRRVLSLERLDPGFDSAVTNPRP
mmetsp:Transcript_2955/g.12193  ORF Transcript_2955/g.12193 Transcript_2955/m.12193 type:complete len:313 (+) Transcript_2955:691-1629(+)